MATSRKPRSEQQQAKAYVLKGDHVDRKINSIRYSLRAIAWSGLAS